MLGSVRELVKEGIDVVVKLGEVLFLMEVNPTFDTRLPRVRSIKSIVSLPQDSKNYLVSLFHVQNKPSLPLE